MSVREYLKQRRLAFGTELGDLEARRRFSPALRSAIDAIRGALERHLGDAVLEVGCGQKPWAPVILARASVYDTLDVEARTQGVTFIGDAQAMTGVRSAAYDTVLCFDVLEHLPEPGKAIAEARRVLAPGGKYVLTVPAMSRIHEAPHDYYRFTEFGLRHLLEREGFEILELEALGGALTFIGHQLATVGVSLTAGLPVIGRLARVLNHQLCVRPAPVLDRALGLERDFPIGYLSVVRRPARHP